MLLAGGAAVVPAAAAPETVRVVLIGDSTMAARTGYGDAFCGLFKWPVECLNLARGGRSTKSYREDGSWDRAVAMLLAASAERKTYVLIQFGHNDQPGKAERTTDLATEFPANLRRYVDELRDLGAHPVLVSPLTRRIFVDGKLQDDLAPWAEATAKVAREAGVPFLDLHAASVVAVRQLGQAEADKLAATPPDHPGFDRTHVGAKGGAFFARLLARQVAQAVPALSAEFVVGAIEPEGPVERPQLDAARAREHSAANVLRGWTPVSWAASIRGPDYIVDALGHSDGRTFTTIRAALDAALRSNLGREVQILVRPGTYDERLDIPPSAPALLLYGEGGDARAVRIRGITRGIQDAVVRVRSRGFHAANLTIENAHNKDSGDRKDQVQAVALKLEDADEAHLENVRLIGFQDTFFLAATNAERPARAFIHRSYIEGDMDFIFGEATAYFLETEIRTLGDRGVSYALAPSTHRRSPHGFVFEASRFTHDGSPHALAGLFKLGRQWYRSEDAVGKVAILRSCIGEHIDAARPWADWSIGTPRHRPVNYEFLAEFENTTGPCY